MSQTTYPFGESSAGNNEFSLPFGEGTSTPNAPASTSTNTSDMFGTSNPVNDSGIDPNKMFGGADRKPPTTIVNLSEALAHLPTAKQYPMPTIPERFSPSFGRWGHYVLPDVDGKPGTSTYPRVTTIGKTLDDTEFLDKWKTGKLIQGLSKFRDVLDLIDPQALADGDRTASDTANALAERVREAVGGSDAGRFGDSVHAWTEFIDLGLGTIEDVPDVVRPYVQAYLNACRAAGIRAEPRYVERIAHNRATGAAGRIDRISRMPDGTLVILDVKTTKNLASGLLGIGVQLSQYATADLMLSEDGTHWEPMPDVSKTLAIVAHIPSVPDPDEGVYCDLIDIDLTRGIRDMHRSTEVRDSRKEKRHLVTGTRQHSLATDTVPELPQIDGAQSINDRILSAIESSNTCDELREVYAAFQSHWTVELAAVGQDRFEVIHAIETAKTPDDMYLVMLRFEDRWTPALTETGMVHLHALGW